MSSSWLVARASCRLLSLRLTSVEHLIDLNRIAELQGMTRENGTLRVGAMTRQAAVERSTDVAGTVPLLSRAVPHIGHFQIRNRGTIGGSVVSRRPRRQSCLRSRWHWTQR